MTRPGARIRRVVPNLHAARPAASRTFYEDVIGLEPAMDMGWIVTFGSAANPTAQLALITRDATAPVHPDVSIEVEDVEAVHREAIARGFDIVHPLTSEPWGVRRFFVRDPTGTVVNVMEHVGP